MVTPLALDWPVPTVQRLWFGKLAVEDKSYTFLLRFATGVEDKQRRLRAFLSVMGADNPLMLQVQPEQSFSLLNILLSCRLHMCRNTCF